MLKGHPAKLLKSSRVKPSGAVFDRTKLTSMYKDKMYCEPLCFFGPTLPFACICPTCWRIYVAECCAGNPQMGRPSMLAACMAHVTRCPPEWDACTGSKMPDGYYTDEGRRDLKRFVTEAIQDWETHSQRLAAAREAARRGREPLSLGASFGLASLDFNAREFLMPDGHCCICKPCQIQPDRL